MFLIDCWILLKKACETGSKYVNTMFCNTSSLKFITFLVRKTSHVVHKSQLFGHICNIPFNKASKHVLFKIKTKVMTS